MPQYEYKCKDCDKTTLVARPFNAEEKTYNCDTCNSELTRVYSSIGVTFNGSGFYSTDK